MELDAEAAVRAQLRDLDSARFSSVQVVDFPSSDNVPAGKAVCGQVNAKNGFGGYVGDRRFYYLPDSRLGAVESEPDDRYFNRDHALYCGAQG